jgi:hypothetical protein
MNQDNLPAAVQQLIDRQQILDCVTRYCRAVDRFDVDLLRSVYHPDAVDDHGEFLGSPEGFIAWVRAREPFGPISKQHHLTNHICELGGDVAHAETYFVYVARNKDETVRTSGGRYLDRFERRGGEWRIATRYCIVEWSGAINEGPVPFAEIPDVHANGAPSRDRTDPSYRRPLTNRRANRFQAG